jgi:hypothetical protein
MIRRQRSAHARIWVVLALALPAALLIVLALALGGPVERPPVRLDPTETGAGG